MNFGATPTTVLLLGCSWTFPRTQGEISAPLQSVNKLPGSTMLGTSRKLLTREPLWHQLEDCPWIVSLKLTFICLLHSVLSLTLAMMLSLWMSHQHPPAWCFGSPSFRPRLFPCTFNLASDMESEYSALNASMHAHIAPTSLWPSWWSW